MYILIVFCRHLLIKMNKQRNNEHRCEIIFTTNVAITTLITDVNNNEADQSTHQNADVRRGFTVETCYEVFQRLIQNVVWSTERPGSYHRTESIYGNTNIHHDSWISFLSRSKLNSMDQWVQAQTCHKTSAQHPPTVEMYVSTSIHTLVHIMTLTSDPWPWKTNQFVPQVQ